MFVKSLGLVLAIAVCGGFAESLAAKSAGQTWKFTADTPEAFEQQAAKVREDMGQSGPYGGIGVADRNAVEADLDKMSELFKRKGSASALSDAEQVDLVNTQEHLNAILTRNDGNRLICTYEKRSGSNFKYKTCMTANERDDVRRRSREGFQDQLLKGGGTQMKGN